MNLFQSLMSAGKRPEGPLHVGEVMGLWSIMLAFQEGRVMILGFANHTRDPEMKRFLEQYLSDFEAPWTKRFQQFMVDQGIPLPNTESDKPKAEERDIPPGAKFTDSEIAGFMAAKLRTGTELVQRATLECLRYDLGAMLLELQAACFRQALVLREMMQKRGWLKVPPEWQGKPGMKHPSS